MIHVTTVMLIVMKLGPPHLPRREIKDFGAVRLWGLSVAEKWDVRGD